MVVCIVGGGTGTLVLSYLGWREGALRASFHVCTLNVFDGDTGWQNSHVVSPW